MAHQHYCDIGAHRYKCSNPECLCFCDLPYETGEHSECPVELRACPNHEEGITAAELRAVKESGAVPILFPSHMPEQLTKREQRHCAGYCLWCGHGYEVYSRKLEAEHLVHNCVHAPEELRKNMKLLLKS